MLNEIISVIKTGVDFFIAKDKEFQKENKENDAKLLKIEKIDLMGLLLLASYQNFDKFKPISSVIMNRANKFKNSLSKYYFNEKLTVPNNTVNFIHNYISKLQENNEQLSLEGLLIFIKENYRLNKDSSCLIVDFILSSKEKEKIVQSNSKIDGVSLADIVKDIKYFKNDWEDGFFIIVNKYYKTYINEEKKLIIDNNKGIQKAKEKISYTLRNKQSINMEKSEIDCLEYFFDAIQRSDGNSFVSMRLKEFKKKHFVIQSYEKSEVEATEYIPEMMKLFFVYYILSIKGANLNQVFKNKYQTGLSKLIDESHYQVPLFYGWLKLEWCNFEKYHGSTQTFLDIKKSLLECFPKNFFKSLKAPQLYKFFSNVSGDFEFSDDKIQEFKKNHLLNIVEKIDPEQLLILGRKYATH